MEEKTPKLPPHRFLLSFHPTKKPRNTKTFTEQAANKKRLDTARGQTRVNIGMAFERWRQLRELKCLKSDAMVAVFLLDSYDEKGTNTSSQYDDEKPGQSPPPVSSFDSHCLSERDDNMEEEELEKSPLSAIAQLEVSIDYEEGSVSDDADSDPEGVPEELDDDTDIKESDSEGVPEEVDMDSEDPDYKPRSGRSSSRVEKRERKSRPGDPRLLGPVSGLPAPCTEELLRTDVSSRMEEDSRLPQPEHSSSHEQTEERPPEAQTQYPRPKKTKDCLTCGKVLSSNEALRRHQVIHSGKRPFKCFICGKGFTQSGNLKTHMKVHKGDLQNWTLLQEKTAPKESPITAHVCGECGMDFPQKEQLEEHRQSHKKPYACPDCSMTFKQKIHLKYHERVHSGDLPFLCKECGKGFITASYLKKHEYTHTGEKNFLCDQCGKAFADTSQLNVHIRTHTGERPHLCSVCGKSYSKAYGLKVHLRVHTGEKPYMCEKCGKCFYFNQNYQHHLRIHNKKPKPTKPPKPLGRPKRQRLVVDNQ